MPSIVAMKEATPTTLRRASRSLRTYKQVLDLLGESNNATFTSLDARLAGLWGEVGYTRCVDGSGVSESCGCRAN